MIGAFRRQLSLLTILLIYAHDAVPTRMDGNGAYMTSPSMPMCRNSSPSGQDLPVELFGLDACAWCYRYIPDVPSFFKQKWNHTWRSVALPGSSANTEEPIRLFNITYLVNSDDNRLVSVADIFRKIYVASLPSIWHGDWLLPFHLSKYIYTWLYLNMVQCITLIIKRLKERSTVRVPLECCWLLPHVYDFINTLVITPFLHTIYIWARAPF